MIASRPLFVIVIGTFLTLCGAQLFSDGMFMDGLAYAALSKNMAIGYGSFWYPHLSDTLWNEFHEHPGLGLWLQSLFF